MASPLAEDGLPNVDSDAASGETTAPVPKDKPRFCYELQTTAPAPDAEGAAEARIPDGIEVVSEGSIDEEAVQPLTP